MKLVQIRLSHEQQIFSIHHIFKIAIYHVKKDDF